MSMINVTQIDSNMPPGAFSRAKKIFAGPHTNFCELFRFVRLHNSSGCYCFFMSMLLLIAILTVSDQSMSMNDDKLT